MAADVRPALGLVALLILAPILAVVLIATLLLLGVEPHLVFLPGFFVRSRLEAFGFHNVPKAVGVLSTGVVWWALVVAVWVGVRRLWRRAA
jgi:hypothetical protein